MKVFTDDKLYMPKTFDVKGYPIEISKRNIIIAILIQIVVTLVSLFFGIYYRSNTLVLVICLFIPFLCFGLVRNFYLQEGYFRRQFEDLTEHDYKYDASMFWKVYDVEEVRGYSIFRLTDKKNVIFVQFVKGVIIGQGDDSRRKHHDALALAYRKMATKKMNFTHIDYMDSVGRDRRFDAMVENMKANVKDSTLEKVLETAYGHLKKQMDKSLSTYDLYAFTYDGDDIEFLDDLKEVLETFMRANYIAYEILNEHAVREIIMSLYNLSDFSIDEAKRQIYKRGAYSTKRLRLIDVVTMEGVFEKKNDTRAEMEAKNKVQKARKSVKVSKKFKKTKDEEIDIFNDET